MEKNKKIENIEEEAKELFKKAQSKFGISRFHDRIDEDEDAYKKSEKD